MAKTKPTSDRSGSAGSAVRTETAASGSASEPRISGKPAGFDPEQAPKDLEENDYCAELLIKRFEKTALTSGIWKYYVANFGFQFVLLGTELDMVGLGMSFLTYWQYNFLPIQILAPYAVIGFFGPLLYVNALRLWGEIGGKSREAGEDASPRSKKKGKKNGGVQGTPDVESGAGTADAKRPPSGRLARCLGSLQPISFYHWCPCARFYMFLLRNVSQADVTALFTVNTLSSFTFGIFQLMGICMTSVLGEPFTVFVLLNCVSQVLNWTITFSYSLTPIAKWMGNAAYVQSLNRRAEDLLKEWNSLSENEGSSISEDTEAARQIHEQKKDEFLARVQKMTLNAFFPIKQGVDAVGPIHENRMAIRQNAETTLGFMRDDHVKRLIMLWRDRQIANLP